MNQNFCRVELKLPITISKCCRRGKPYERYILESFVPDVIINIYCGVFLFNDNAIQVSTIIYLYCSWSKCIYYTWVWLIWYQCYFNLYNTNFKIYRRLQYGEFKLFKPIYFISCVSKFIIFWIDLVSSQVVKCRSF